VLNNPQSRRRFERRKNFATRIELAEEGRRPAKIAWQREKGRPIRSGERVRLKRVLYGCQNGYDLKQGAREMRPKSLREAGISSPRQGRWTGKGIPPKKGEFRKPWSAQKGRSFRRRQQGVTGELLPRAVSAMPTLNQDNGRGRLGKGEKN